jgi:CheY-like chemotaxis protein
MNNNQSRQGDRDFLLIAEDNPADVVLIRLALQKYGVLPELYVIQDGEAAVRFIEKVEADDLAACPVLALVDLNLPRVGGDELLRRVRASEKWRNVPVIVMSSSLSTRDRTDALQRGAAAFFSKPSDLEQFLMLGALVKATIPTAKSKRAS